MKISRRALLTAASVGIAATPARAATELAVRDTKLLVNGRPLFLTGISYYAALGAPETFVEQDLADMRRLGFQWLRVWATWDAFENDVSAVDGSGATREPYLSRLKSLVRQAEAAGLLVDVTLTRSLSASGIARLQSLEAHQRAVEVLVTDLRPWRNWYLDLANERSIRDKRYAGMKDLQQLRERVRQLDPGRLVTASHGGDIGPDELRAYVRDVGVDFITPHRPREPGSAAETEKKTREYLAQMAGFGRVVPVHYQEPFRRGYTAWQPAADDFSRDLGGARAGGGAGWCFHNGDQRGTPGNRPRRSFDLREKRLFDQLDAVERGFVAQLQR